MFEAHGAVEGKPTTQPTLDGGSIPEVNKPVSSAPEAPKPAPQMGQSTLASSAQAPEAEAPAPYTPNFKFKVMDKEHEIDEFVRAAIKDADTEKKIKEIYEKAYGLDVLKPRYQGLREKYQTSTQEVESFKKSIGELREHYQRGDLDSFFQTLNVPQEKILQWVLDKANYEQLPPDQRQILDAKRAAEQQAYSLGKEKQQLMQQHEEVLLQARAQSLQVALERPDVSEFAKSFEERAGKPGSFVEEIIAHGERTYYASQGKIDLTPEQAIKEVMDRWAPFVSQQPMQPPIIPANPGPGAAPQAQRAAPAAPKATTIPNVSGRQTTAVSKAKPKSIDDLKKLYREKAGL
jgi:predicted  nucleic acid-binding Zn-ribbon protein